MIRLTRGPATGARILQIQVRGWRFLIGYNAEKTLRFGIHREETFTAYGCWPLLIGVQTPRQHGRSLR